MIIIKKWAIILLGAVFILGCTGSEEKGGASTSKGLYGVVISEFTAQFATIEADDSTGISIKLTNKGDQQAKNVKAEMLNYGSLIPEGKGMYDGFLDLMANETDLYLWDVAAPKVVTLTRTYQPQVRVCYDYKSTALSDWYVVHKDKYKEDQVPELIMQESNGPLLVSVASIAEQPARVDSEGKTRYVKVEITNREGGQVATNYGTKNKGSFDEIDKGLLTVEFHSFSGAVDIIDETARINIASSNNGCSQDDLASCEFYETCENSQCIVNSPCTQNCAWECSLIEDKAKWECMYNNTIKFIGGTTATPRLKLNMTSGAEVDDGNIGTVNAELNYKYCLLSEPISITVQKIE